MSEHRRGYPSFSSISLRLSGGTGGYVGRDARLAGEVNDWQQFGLFMRLVSALTAQEINYSELGREISLTPQSARRWLQVLRARIEQTERASR